MITTRNLLTVVLVASVAVGANAADPPKPSPPSKEQIAKWIKQLGSEDFTERMEASQKLWEAGEAAEEAVRAATKDDDAEIRRSSGELLDKFKWGIYPDTPKALLDLLTKYQAGDSSARVELIRPFLDQGVPGCRILVKVIHAEADPTIRVLLYSNLLSRELPRVIPMLLKEKQHALVEQLLDGALDNDFDIAICHYVAWWRLRERLDERIAHHTKLEGKENKRQVEILTYLQRAKGDAPDALAAARRSGNDRLIDGVLFEMGSWKELAFRGNAIDGDSRAEQLAHRATFHHLAGNVADAKENYAEMRRYAATLPVGDSNGQAMTIAKAFFVNDMPDDALEVLKASGSWVMAYEILVARFRFAEADALVEKVRGTPDMQNIDPLNAYSVDVMDRLSILQARTWYLLGDKAKALPVFARYGNKLRDTPIKGAWLDDLIDAEIRADLTEQAFEHAAQILVEDKGDFWTARVLRRLFPRQKETAYALFEHLRTSKDAPVVATVLKRVRALLAGKTSQKEVIALLDEAGPVLDAMKKEGDDGGLGNLQLRFSDGSANRDARWKALAEVALLAGLEARSQTCLEKADSADCLVELGDRLAAKKQWEAAARWYQKAWDKERSQPLPLYLYGHALVQAGRDKDGREAMLQAHWLPLGDDAARHIFAVELLKRNQGRDSQRENDLIVHIGEIGGWYSAEAVRRNGLEALARKEYLVCADVHERAMLRVLRTQINFLQTSAYMAVPSLIHRYRAVGLVKAGKAAEAVKEAELALTLMPSDLDAAIMVVPDLEALGKKEEAAQLYRRSRAAYEQLCKDFPRSTLGHNGLAWLAACCHRDLDDALVHARKAVELAPDNASHLDTLAEVYFQLGQKDRAIETQKKAVALSPKRSYYRKQLQRFKAGDLKAERPDENAFDDDDDD